MQTRLRIWSHVCFGTLPTISAHFLARAPLLELHVISFLHSHECLTVRCILVSPIHTPPLLLSSRAKDLLEIMSKGAAADPLLSALDGSIRSLLQAWFSVGFLELRRITFEDSGGALLEKIAR